MSKKPVKSKRGLKKLAGRAAPPVDYGRLVSEISGLLEQARRGVARAVNAILTATYWEIGRRIVEHEQGGKARAEYGEEVLDRLSRDLAARHGRGFSARNLWQMRAFHMGWEIWQTPSAKFEARAICPDVSGEAAGTKFQTPSGKFEIRQTPSYKSLAGKATVQTPSGQFETPPASPQSASKAILQTPSAEFNSLFMAGVFPLSWSHYVRLLSVDKPHARAFYESEAIRGGWSVRQLDRQIGTQFFERTAHSKRQAVMLARGQQTRPEDAVAAQDEVRDPYLLEFLNLKDEYSESELEEALIRHMEWFLLELGAGFTFVARQKRIRVGGRWYRIDLLLYHRVLRCLVVVDLKTEAFTHADAGQMNLYLNYTREHLAMAGEGEPIGIILCSDRDDAVVKYAMGGIRAQVFASKYMTELPDTETLRQEIVATKHALQTRAAMKGQRNG